MAKTNQSESHDLDSLLINKVKAPSLSQKIIHRSRLIDILQSGRDQQVTLLVAPTGYGKTTLLVDWLSCASTADWRIVWVTLDSFDDTPFRFWSYVVLGLRRALPHLRFGSQQLMQYGLQPEDLTLLNPLINEIEQLPYPIYLILDDYQAITDSTIHHSLEYLINYQPANLHLILSSRVAPPILLSRQQSQGRVIEIAAQDLSFTFPEAQAFLCSVMGLIVDQDQTTMLHNATEGWIAGLKLAALAMQGHQNLLLQHGSFPFGQRKIITYLIEEVLNHQDPDVRDFLLKTSILPELSPELCDAVFNRTDSQAMIQRIERANLFIVPLDKSREWFRYHSFFSDALQDILKRTDPQFIQRAHRRAHQWLRSNRYADKAITHALAAGDIETAAEIVDGCALQAIIDYNIASLTYWISQFSPDLLRQRPQLYLYDALATSFMRKVDLAESKLQKLEQLLQEDEQGVMSDELKATTRWRISAVRAVMNALEGDTAQTIQTIKTLLNHVPEKEIYFYGYLNNTLAVLHDLAEDYQSAMVLYERGRQYSIKQNLVNEYVESNCDLARVLRRMGKLSDAQRIYDQALQFATQHATNAGVITLAKTGLMSNALEKNDLETAKYWALDVARQLERNEESQIAFFYPRLASWLAYYYFVTGEVDKANVYWNKITLGLVDSPEANYPAEIIDIQVYHWLMTGDLEPGERWLSQRVEYLRPMHKEWLTDQIGLARIRLAQGKPALALSLLADIEKVAHQKEINERDMEASILKAKAFWMQGKSQKAFHAIDKAVNLAASEGYMRMFLSEGEVIKSLLMERITIDKQDRSSPEGSPKCAYLLKIIKAFEPRITKQPQPPNGAFISNGLVSSLPEPLSVRELEVLQLLCNGSSVKEVAANLAISINTAKAHVRRIYEKLGVHARRELLKRSRDLGFLVTSPQ